VPFVLASKSESYIDPSDAGRAPANGVALPLRPDVAGCRPQNDELCGSRGAGLGSRRFMRAGRAAAPNDATQSEAGEWGEAHTVGFRSTRLTARAKQTDYGYHRNRE
jgi:hypothetical protein